jgi:hypothetical protein
LLVAQVEAVALVVRLILDSSLAVVVEVRGATLMQLLQ